ncbi:MAG: hypothetical protein MJ252_12190 [archaeon]|nr:hypothetical protein [archaeon]
MNINKVSSGINTFALLRINKSESILQEIKDNYLSFKKSLGDEKIKIENISEVFQDKLFNLLMKIKKTYNIEFESQREIHNIILDDLESLFTKALYEEITVRLLKDLSKNENYLYNKTKIYSTYITEKELGITTKFNKEKLFEDIYSI